MKKLQEILIHLLLRASLTDTVQIKSVSTKNLQLELNICMEEWYDWDASDAPEWSLYREWFDEDEMDDRFMGSGGYTDEGIRED